MTDGVTRKSQGVTAVGKREHWCQSKDLKFGKKSRSDGSLVVQNDKIKIKSRSDDSMTRDQFLS